MKADEVTGTDGAATIEPQALPPWVFGIDPLDQTCELARAVRRVTALAIAQERPQASIDRLLAVLSEVEAELGRSAPADVTPRLGAQATDEQRVYLDHGFDVGRYHPAFPEYDITVDGNRASGAVTFSLFFEGPPMLVYGGFIGMFFDQVIQQHNCVLGVTGKTATLNIRYRRPTPVLTPLRFDIERETADGRITSVAKLFKDDELLAIGTMEAVAGDFTKKPVAWPRNVAS